MGVCPGAGREGDLLLPPVTLIWDAVGEQEPYHFRSLVLVTLAYPRFSALASLVPLCPGERGDAGILRAGILCFMERYSAVVLP